MGLKVNTVIVSASRHPPRPLEAQRFFDGAVLGCFLAFYFLDAFLACLGSFLGLRPVLGALWGSRGLSWGSLEALWGSLGPLFGSPGALLAPY